MSAVEPVSLDGPLRAERRRVNVRLRAILSATPDVPAQLRRAMAHSLLGAGKRLRPILLLWSYDAAHARRRRSPPVTRRLALDAACALEMIHTYSLIHDDLPAMDDDALRRGRPTCHVVFGEATAILAGDALQALGYAVLARLGAAGLAALTLVADAVGPGGMVGGQQLDLEAEGRPVTGARIHAIHRRKTAALLAAALGAGASLGGAKRPDVARLVIAGHWLGLAFQGADDLLDASGDPGRLGKSVGKDGAAGKATWIRLEGPARARARTAKYGEVGLAALRAALPVSPEAERLEALARRLWERDR